MNEKILERKSIALKNMVDILLNKNYNEASVFLPENLLREARRQRNIHPEQIPEICILDPDGDLADYLIKDEKATMVMHWACYHSKMFSFELDNNKIGIIPCVVGSSYAVLVAEQLFVSGCKVIISVTSAGIINNPKNNKRFALITQAVRDEGTSYHYLPAEAKSILSESLTERLKDLNQDICPYFEAKSWTTDAPYRETNSAIDAMREDNICCVEMEAAALYAFAIAKQKDIICLAHLTNTMAQSERDFEKGELFGSLDTLELLSYILKRIYP